MQDIETKTENYTVTWTWNLAYDDQMNMHQVVIPNCKHQKDAEQKAFEYMLDTWINKHDTMEEMIDECFASLWSRVCPMMNTCKIMHINTGGVNGIILSRV